MAVRLNRELRRPFAHAASSAVRPAPVPGKAPAPVRRRVSTGSEAISRRLADEWTARERLRLIVETGAERAAGASHRRALAAGAARRKWAQGVEAALEKPLVLIPLGGGLPERAFLWCIRTWVLRRRIREPGPIQLVAMEDATVAPPPAATVTVLSMGDGLRRLRRQSRPSQARRRSAPRITRSRPALPCGAAVRPSPSPPARARTDRPDRDAGAADVDRLRRALGRRSSTSSSRSPPWASCCGSCSPPTPTRSRRRSCSATPRRRRLVEITVLVAGARRCGRSGRRAGSRRSIGRRTRSARWWSRSAAAASAAPGHWRGKALDDQSSTPTSAFSALARAPVRGGHGRALRRAAARPRQPPSALPARAPAGGARALPRRAADIPVDPPGAQGADRGSRRERQALQRLELLARYRATILLGWGERLAEQWVPARHARALEAVAELAEPRAAAAGSARPIPDIDIGAWDRGRSGSARHRERRHQSAPRRRTPTTILVEVPAPRKDSELATVEQQRRARPRAAQADHRGGPPRCACSSSCARATTSSVSCPSTATRVRALDTEITLLALRLLPAWARVRAQSARHALAASASPGSHRAAESAGRSAVAAVPDTVRGSGGSGGRRTRPLKELERSEVFLDHYNAACTFAVALLPERRPRAAVRRRARALAGGAVAELECACAWGEQQDRGAVGLDPEGGPRPVGPSREPEFQQFESDASRRRSPRRCDRPRSSGSSPPAIAHIFRECAARLERSGTGARTNAADRRPRRAALVGGGARGLALARNLSRPPLLADAPGPHKSDAGVLLRPRVGRVRRAQAGVPEQPIQASATRSTSRRPRDPIAHERIRALDRNSSGRPRARRRRVGALPAAGRMAGQDEKGHGRRLAINRASAWGDLRVAIGRWLDRRGAARREAELAAAAAKIAALPAPLHPRTQRPADAAACSSSPIARWTQELRAELVLRARPGTDIQSSRRRSRWGPLRHDGRREGDRGAPGRLRDALDWADGGGCEPRAPSGPDRAWERS